MSISPRASRSDVQAQIVVAATQLFANTGFEATTVEDIVNAASVSKPAMYRSFESKEELYCHIINAQAERLFSSILAQGTTRKPKDQRLRLIVEAWFDVVEASPDASRVLFQQPIGYARITERLESIKQQHLSNDAQLLRTYARKLPSQSITPIAEMLRASLIALTQWWLNNPGVERGVAEDAMVALVGGLVQAERLGTS